MKPAADAYNKWLKKHPWSVSTSTVAVITGAGDYFA